MPGDAKHSRVKDVGAFLDEARRLYQFGLDADELDRREAQADNVFANATDDGKEQWPSDMKQQRIDTARPVIQWNRIPTYVQQVGNASREMKPSIRIDEGVDGKAETAEFFQNRTRHIEYECNADIAYDTSGDQQVTSGRGFIRVSTEYVQGTFTQRACIEPIENQFSVVWDPAARKYDCSDGDWWFVISQISHAEHVRKYGEESIVSQLDFTSGYENPAPGWVGVGKDNQLIQIAEYWRKEYAPRMLCELADGTVGWLEDVPEGARIVGRREEQDVTICRYVINGAEILEEGAWIGKRIPIVPVWGRTAVVDGKRRTFSLIRNAKEPQRLLNYEVSNLVEQLGQMPKTPYMVAVGQIPSGHEEVWQKIGSNPVGFALYQRFDENGRDLGVPTRIVQEPPIQALSIAIQQAIDAIKASMGIFDAAIGARSNETSGVAIQRRQKESDVANFHFPDNQARSRKAIGEILIQIIPLLDKPGTKASVRFEDGKTETVPIGQPYRDPKTKKEVVHVLTSGDYGVTVETGPSYTSAKQEANERYTTLVTAQPELMFVIGDKLLRTAEFPGSEEAADRLEKFISLKTPGLVEGPEDQQPIPPQVQQRILETEQKLAQTEAFAQSLHQKIETKQPELDNAVKLKEMDLDFKREELQAKTNIELAKLGSAEAATELKLHTAHIDQERALGHAEQQAGAARQHDMEMSNKQQANALESQEQQHEGALEQQEQAAGLAPEPVGANA